MVAKETVKTMQEAFDLMAIPCAALFRVGCVFKEGEVKYGRDNWRLGIGDKAYQLERANYALKHLLLYIHRLRYDEALGEPGEDDLAKVLWFCLTQSELERLETSHPPPVPRA